MNKAINEAERERFPRATDRLAAISDDGSEAAAVLFLFRASNFRTAKLGAER